MTCQCGFDNTPAEGGEQPTKCLGCGKPLRPDSDDPMHRDKPAPGFQINPLEDDDGEPHVVTDQDRERYEELEDVLVIHTLRYEWGNGIGCAPYGYFTRERVEVQRADDSCPECGHDEELVTFAQGHAAIAGSKTIECDRCGHVKEDDFWC